MIDSQRDIGRTSVDMGEVLRDISFPNADLDSLDVSFPDSGSAPQSRAQQKDLFAVQKRKSWDKSTEARCDFSYKLRLTRRSNVNFVSIWHQMSRTIGSQQHSIVEEMLNRQLEDSLE